MIQSMQRSTTLAVACLIIVALGNAADGGARRVSKSVNACSLLTAPAAKLILGYPVRLMKGETVEDCNLTATPIYLDPETLQPRHPGLILEVDKGRPGACSKLTSLTPQQTLHARVTPVSGLGSRAAIVWTTNVPATAGSYFLCAEVRGSILQLSVGVAKTPISHTQGVKLAKLAAAKL